MVSEGDKNAMKTYMVGKWIMGILTLISEKLRVRDQPENKLLKKPAAFIRETCISFSEMPGRTCLPLPGLCKGRQAISPYGVSSQAMRRDRRLTGKRTGHRLLITYSGNRFTIGGVIQFNFIVGV